MSNICLCNKVTKETIVLAVKNGAKTYEEVKEELKGLGFTNFVIKEMAMSKIGWGEKEEGVAKIIIDDKAQFAKDTWFPEEAEVRIYYYVRV